MRLLLRIVAAGAGAAALASCGPTIRSERDETIPVPSGATWAWEAARADTGREASPVGEIVEQRFRRAMEGAMRTRGFHQVEQPAEAEFVLSARFGARRDVDGVPGRRAGAVVVGVSTGWGYGAGPRGFGRFGWYQPWGVYEPWGLMPWGWGFYGMPVWGIGPAYRAGPRLWSDAALVVVLRRRASGEVAWSGRLGSDAFGSSMTQDRVQQLVDKLFKDLR